MHKLSNSATQDSWLHLLVIRLGRRMPLCAMVSWIEPLSKLHALSSFHYLIEEEPG